jgi:hypothetical protein
MLLWLLGAVIGVAVATQLWAFPETARRTKAACVTCHTNPAGGAGLNTAGTAFKADHNVLAASTAKAAEYVGGNKCKMCHAKQHKAWLETPHARAWAGLVHGDPKKSAEIAAALKVEIKESPAKTDGCVTCHVTGFQLAGGFPQADTTKAVANVTCEGCHGPGSLHVAAPMAQKKASIAKPGEAMCKQCHTSVTSPNFTFAEFAKRGVHATAAAAAK